MLATEHVFKAVELLFTAVEKGTQFIGFTNVKFGVGGPSIQIVAVCVVVAQGFDVVSVTVYVPGKVYVCEGLVSVNWFRVSKGDPSPKSQMKVVNFEHDALFPRMVVFVNRTDVFTQRFVGTVKFAVGPLYTFIGFTLEKELSQKLDALILNVNAFPG